MLTARTEAIEEWGDVSLCTLCSNKYKYFRQKNAYISAFFLTENKKTHRRFGLRVVVIEYIKQHWYYDSCVKRYHAIADVRGRRSFKLEKLTCDHLYFRVF